MRRLRVWTQRVGRWIETVTEPWEHRLESGLDRVSAVRTRIDARVDAAAAGSLAGWLRYFAQAFVVTGCVVLALRLLLALTLGSGSWVRWIGVAVVGSVALVLELTVVRNVVISIAEPAHRRSLLIAFVTSVAIVMISVEAFASATAAIAGPPLQLWTAERFYLWHLVDSVPLLAIPQRLGWSETPLATAVGGRLLVLGFKVAVIAPLVRVVVAFYELTEGEGNERRHAVARAQPAPAADRRSARRWRSALYVPVLVVAGFVYGGLGPGTVAGHRLASLPAPALAGAAFGIAAVAVALCAAVAALTVLVIDQLWAVVTEDPTALAVVTAVAIVWFHRPVRLRAPTLLGITLDRVDFTFLVWLAVATVAMLVWADPQMPETVLALGLVLSFAGTHAPAQAVLAGHVTWTPGGFATSRALIAAGLALTGGCLIHLLAIIPSRAREAGRLSPFDPSSDLRQQLRAYLWVCAQVVTAAAAALMLLQHLGVTPRSSRGPLAAPDALLAVTWHVLDALPGPDIPAVLDWRLATDFTGRWAGLVVIVAVASILAIAAFPMTRTLVQWAKLKAGLPPTSRASTDLPAAVLADLEAALGYLVERRDAGGSGDRPFRLPGLRHRPDRSPEAERHLVDAELARRPLLELLGRDAAVYRAAALAMDTTVEAYRLAVTTTFWQRRLLPGRGGTGAEAAEAKARTAVDAYRPLVHQWQDALRPLTVTPPGPPAAPAQRRPAGIRYGYAQVSPEEPDRSDQYPPLLAAGVAPEHIVSDRVRADAVPRPRLDELLAVLRPGDQLVVTRMRRLARSQQHLRQLAAWLDDHDVDLIVLEQGIDTTTPAGREFFHLLNALDAFDHDGAARPRALPERRPWRRGTR